MIGWFRCWWAGRHIYAPMDSFHPGIWKDQCLRCNAKWITYRLPFPPPRLVRFTWSEWMEWLARDHAELLNVLENEKWRGEL